MHWIFCLQIIWIWNWIDIANIKDIFWFQKKKKVKEIYNSSISPSDFISIYKSFSFQWKNIPHCYRGESSRDLFLWKFFGVSYNLLLVGGSIQRRLGSRTSGRHIVMWGLLYVVLYPRPNWRLRLLQSKLDSDSSSIVLVIVVVVIVGWQ